MKEASTSKLATAIFIAIVAILFIFSIVIGVLDFLGGEIQYGFVYIIIGLVGLIFLLT